MSKVMIVEDDDSLREIYAIRLTAEGYVVISAHDGEEALAVAVKERPDLIISDVMMPKISGFDMLDILRSTPETQNIKVIMMTALSSEDQRERGENLGADRYIVKSQVGIEDVVNVVHEVLGDRDPGGAIDTTAPIEMPGNSGGQMMNTNGQAAAPAANGGQAGMSMAGSGVQVGQGQVPGFSAAEQFTNTPTQAMPPVPNNTQVAAQPSFAAAEQVTNIPTQAMPPVMGGVQAGQMQPGFTPAEQANNIPTQAMPPLPNTPDQPTAVPPSIMPPVAG